MRAVILAIALVILAGCKVVIPVSGEGRVASASGAHDCEASQTCEIDVVDTFFDETFTAQPSAGQVFLGWQKRGGRFCGGSTDSCALSTAAFAGNELLEQFLETDTAFYMEPVFAVEAGSKYGVRYCEVLIFFEEPDGLLAEVWNSEGLSECPEEQWRALDTGAIAAEAGAVYAWANGPRFWVRDDGQILGFPPGFVALENNRRDFGGIELRLVTSVQVPSSSINEQAGYKAATVSRDTVWIYRAGRRVYELQDPEGARYVMQSYSTEIDPGLDVTELRYLGERLQMPEGWQYRSYILEEELQVPTIDGTAHMVTDEYANTYQRIPGE